MQLKLWSVVLEGTISGGYGHSSWSMWYIVRLENSQKRCFKFLIFLAPSGQGARPIVPR
jgi:hypothetical protein